MSEHIEAMKRAMIVGINSGGTDDQTCAGIARALAASIRQNGVSNKVADALLGFRHEAFADVIEAIAEDQS